MLLIFSLLDTATIRSLRLVSRSLHAHATAQISHLSYDPHTAAKDAPLDVQLRAVPQLRSLHSSYGASASHLAILLSEPQLSKVKKYIDFTARQHTQAGELSDLPPDGLSGLRLNFDKFYSIEDLAHYTALQSLSLQPSVSALRTPIVASVQRPTPDGLLYLTGLTELNWVDPGQSGPGPLEEALPLLLNLANLRVLCGVTIWSESHLGALVSLTALTQLDFAIHGPVRTTALTTLSLVKRLGVEWKTSAGDYGTRQELVASIAKLTQLEGLLLDMASYRYVGHLGGSLRKLASLTLCSDDTISSFVPSLSGINFSNLCKLSISLTQLGPCDDWFDHGWTVLRSATRLEDLSLDLLGYIHADGLEMCKAAASPTLLTNLKARGLKFETETEELQGVDNLASLTRLASLSLSVDSVNYKTMTVLQQLSSLTRLELLDFNSSTPRGLSQLTALTRLAVLGLHDERFAERSGILESLRDFQYQTGMRVVECYSTRSH